MSNDLVGYSRAGDVFHYRWAARRCLRMVYPNSVLKTVVIEGSKEDQKAGEYVIDVSEYYEPSKNIKKIHYYQLKHTTVQGDTPFILSDLKETFEGFSKRFIQHRDGNGGYIDVSEIFLIIVTNRKIDSAFKANIEAISKKHKADTKFTNTIKRYTNLDSDELALFCKLIQFEDSEGNYNVQKDELRIELSQLIAGVVDNVQLDALEALVKDKVLPDSDGQIVKEDVLRKFGMTSALELYPAPAQWEEQGSIILREQYEDLKTRINDSTEPIIIHAAGGVGKSIFCRHFISSIPDNSFGIAFDCFGAGNYRRRSETRHLHRKALVQIANELAAQGLCDPLIVLDNSLDESIMKDFILKIQAAIDSLKKANDSAKLFILIDAADNAEMAAKEFNQPCFVHELLREKMPVDSRLVMLCRSERIHLLKPESSVLQLELESFSQDESIRNLLEYFPNSIVNEGIEFHRLTGGNPRVQANALSINPDSIASLLSGFGPSGTSVQEQIGIQLSNAVNKIKDLLPNDYQDQIDALCTGLASLPPHIPIDILAKTSSVKIDTVKSFIADLGRPLWLTDSSVQFRDEPTETWFRETYCGKKSDFENYISLLEPLAIESVYVAEVLPQLYIQAEQYEKLIEIALSDQYLPDNNPIDARNVRVYRLQFAFKAALKINNYEDSIKVAMRAGEEVAGDRRQLNLFQNNIDLISVIQDREKVQELAFKRVLRNEWPGSENVFSASLLSGIDDYKGEAIGFLRASINWMNIFFDEHKNDDPDDRMRHDYVTIENHDILELAYAHLNIYGEEGCIAFLERFNQGSWVLDVLKSLARRLIDFGNFQSVERLLLFSKRNQYFTIALSSELMNIGKIPEIESIKGCLNLLNNSKHRIEKSRDPLQDRVVPNILSFLEACIHRKLPSTTILRVLDYYYPEKRASYTVYNTFTSSDRDIFLRALVIRILLKGEQDMDQLMPSEFLGEKIDYQKQRDKDEYKSVINGMLPWYKLRLKIISGNYASLKDLDQVTKSSDNARRNRYRNNDNLPREICSICISILRFNTQASQEEIEYFFDCNLQKSKAFYLPEKLVLLRSAFRLEHLSWLRSDLESSIYKIVKSMEYTNTPDDVSDYYIDLARAVLVNSLEDSSVYFEEAVEIVSKFGDEIAERWGAIVGLARKIESKQSDELAYRFIRCAEVVGDAVDREKYWDRGVAIALCTKMSHGIGISSLSRWRDRDIGSFEWLHYNVILELLQTNSISATVGWALSFFHSTQQRQGIEYIDDFLNAEPNKEIKNFILNDYIHLLQVDGVQKCTWSLLTETADKHGLSHEHLNTETKEVHDSSFTQPKEELKPKESNENEQLTEIFDGLDLQNISGLNESLSRWKNANWKNHIHIDRSQYWNGVINRTEHNDIWNLIELVLLSPNVEKYDMTYLIQVLPLNWRNKISVKKQWPNFIFRIGEKFAFDLCEPQIFKFFIEGQFDEIETDHLRNGIFNGLAETCEFADARHFFGFVQFASALVDQQKIPTLLDYSLSRFEPHIDTDFGDGPWGTWLIPPVDLVDSIGGFIWSALGSPRTNERWSAVHVVQKLAQLNCSNVIDSLIKWLDHDQVDAFGSKEYKFYNLHARQYFMIACARISKETPNILLLHKNVFVKYSLSEPHILIQKYAAQVVLEIENHAPGSYEDSVIEQVEKIGKSSFPIQEAKYGYSVDSVWHQNNEVDSESEFNFAWDFDQYWFEPLGRVFGISGKQVQDLATMVVKGWGVNDSGYNNDPRVGLWNNHSHERETWHDHGNYPKWDNQDFYLSYHSMLIVAAKLIDRMPVVQDSDWHDNAWEEWLSQHSLTRSDGKWLSDFKDPVPSCRPSWVGQNIVCDDWETNISDDDFLNCLKSKESDELWINVKGGWVERANGKSESFLIHSALVSQETSNSLMNALQTCSNPHDFELPSYSEETYEDDGQYNSSPFILKGWVMRFSVTKGLDEHDPYAEGIDYPPYIIGEKIVQKLGLKSKNDNRHWCFQSQIEKSVIVCESWSGSRSYKEEPEQSGKRLKSRLTFLKELCKKHKCHLVFEVQIKRDDSSRSRETKEYRMPTHKIYILSEDGKLSTTETSYQLG